MDTFNIKIEEMINKAVQQQISQLKSNTYNSDDEDNENNPYKIIKQLEADIEYLHCALENNIDVMNDLERERNNAIRLLQQINRTYGIVKHGNGKLQSPELIKLVPYQVKEDAILLIREI